jgi:NADH-quinone oxidoreductase subunit M
VQKDLKRLIAYSSVAHMGFIILGIFSLTTIGLDGALFNMVSHPLTTGALFLLIGMLYERRRTRQISELKGIWNVAPIFTAFFLVATLAGIGVPGFSGFIGEFLALLGTFLVHRPYAIIAAVGVIFAAVYMLWAFRRVFTSDADEPNRVFPDLSVREIVVVAPLLAMSLFLGVYPKPVLDRVEPTAEVVITHFEERTDYSEPDVNVEIIRTEEKDAAEENSTEEGNTNE